MMLFYNVTLASVAIVAVLLYSLLRWMIYQPLRDATTEQIIHAEKWLRKFAQCVK